MTKNDITVIKATGKKEPFSESKVRSSIRRAEIQPDLEEQVVEHVKTILYNNIPTSEIYKHIIEFLDKAPYPGARAKYSLKQAIMDLGPTGYPFEKFIAAVLTQHGYQTQTNEILQGKCVQHEIDVIATKDHKRYMIEAKFHQRPGTRSDIKAALYTYARYLDINKFDQPWLVTNTKATSDAIDYANCMQMRIISWSYPKHGNLRELIEILDLHPITVLSDLSDEQKNNLLNESIALCRQILKLSDKKLLSLGFSPREIKQLQEEAKAVCR